MIDYFNITPSALFQTFCCDAYRQIAQTKPNDLNDGDLLMTSSYTAAWAIPFESILDPTTAMAHSNVIQSSKV